MERRQKDFTWRAKKIVCHTVTNSPDNLYLAATLGAYRWDSWASHTNPLGLKVSLQHFQPPARKKRPWRQRNPKDSFTAAGWFPRVLGSVLALLGSGGRKKDCLFFSIAGGFPGMRKWHCIWKSVSSYCPCPSMGKMLWPPGRSCCVTGRSWDNKSYWDWKIKKANMRLKWQDNILRLFISFLSSPPTYSIRFSSKSRVLSPAA